MNTASRSLNWPYRDTPERIREFMSGPEDGMRAGASEREYEREKGKGFSDEER